MEKRIDQSQAVVETSDNSTSSSFQSLNELELAIVGGGIGDTVL